MTGWKKKTISQHLNKAIVELQNLPISFRLPRNTHKALLQRVRGEHKLPGEFRISQNWIGGAIDYLVNKKGERKRTNTPDSPPSP